MERRRGEHRVDGPLPAFVGGKLGGAAEGAPDRLQASGQHRPRHLGARNGDIHPELTESFRHWDKDTA